MPNALAHEKSPYLLQHAENPVNWLPWGDAAFERARAERRPVFLSIGYSTCHWCHVMAHESFENEAIAALLNEHFIPVKVDREERPDVDRVYMTYVQAVTGHGGWPLSAWLTPELKPFYGGTYFPPEDRQGRAGFPSILKAIAQGWAQDPEKLIAEGDRVVSVLREHLATVASKSDEPTAADEKSFVDAASTAFEAGFQHFYESFDPTNGGFGGAPKFPRASNLSFLFRVATLQGPTSDIGKEAVAMAAATLQAMARGGIHDHVGGGFHRYSVDERWFVPHFEKMLYDQAQIAVNCLEARQATDDERFAWLARDILDYVLRDLTHASGGFFTAEDADSLIAHGSDEHAEGAFYVWTHEELREVLGEDAPLFLAQYGAEAEGNVPAALDPQGELRGRNILVQRLSLLDTARTLGLAPEEANDRVLSALQRLRDARSKRPRPHLDDKLLAANNGLMISALVKARQVLGAEDGAAARSDAERYIGAAVKAAEFLRRELFDDARGILYRTWRDGRGTVEGFAEDYANVVQAAIDLYEATFDIRWLQWAERLQVTMDTLFWDEARGGYFNSARDDAHLVLRLKEDYDGAEPAPSSVAAMNLLRLSAILNADELRVRARRTLDAFRARWTHAPHALPQMLCALELALEPPRHVVLAGDPRSAEFAALAGTLHERLGPRRAILGVDGASGQDWLATRAPWLAEMKPLDGKPTAFVCEEFTCRAPVTDPDALRRILADAVP